MGSVNDKVIWITGASSGIGEQLAYELAKKGATLILSARRKEALERVKGNCAATAQPNIRVLPLDLEKAETLQLSTQAAIQFFGHIDILVNNGGVTQRSLLNDTSPDVIRRLMEVNFFGAAALTKYLLPHFIQRTQGQFVVVSSVTGKFGTPYRSGYAASKHALMGFFDSVRAEHYKDNITVTMVCPGFVYTPICYAALTGDGSPLNQMDEAQRNGKPADLVARKMIRAIEQKKEEVYLGGKEVWMVYIKRLAPRLFSKIIRQVKVR